MEINKQFGITLFQSQCLVGYSKYAKISTRESSRLFRKYKIFEFISDAYDVLEFDSVEFVVKNYIAKRIRNKERYINRIGDED